MGRKTYDSIPRKFSPLSNRINIVLTKNKDYKNKDVIVNYDIMETLLYLHNNKTNYNNVYIIGGTEIYSQFLNLKIVSNMYITKVNYDFNCDTFMPTKYLKHFSPYGDILDIVDINCIDSSTHTLHFCKYKYVNKEEVYYLKSLKKILDKGVYNLDRTKVGTLSLFGKSFKYDVRNYRLPLFTHRKMFVRGIIEELLFFISGKTNTKILEDKKVNIWKGNTSREFLDSRGLVDFKEGDMGSGYPFLLRHWGAKYVNADTDYSSLGFDQLNYVINEIKNNPTSRRIVFSYWNPSYTNTTALMPCHILYMFHVNIDTNELSCSFTQRSSDSPLAQNFNVISATLLVFMLCKLTNLMPGKIIHNVGNNHIYMSHIDEVKQFIHNEPMNFPIMLIDDPDNEIKTIDDFRYKHFKLLLYNSYKKYNLTMAV
jgi:dihydrofolate reductase/thymidylate synthase